MSITSTPSQPIIIDAAHRKVWLYIVCVVPKVSVCLVFATLALVCYGVRGHSSRVVLFCMNIIFPKEGVCVCVRTGRLS